MATTQGSLGMSDWGAPPIDALQNAHTQGLYTVPTSVQTDLAVPRAVADGAVAAGLEATVRGSVRPDQ